MINVSDLEEPGTLFGDYIGTNPIVLDLFQKELGFKFKSLPKI